MNEINLIPLLDPFTWDDCVENELKNAGISTYYKGDTFHVDWEDEEDFPHLKKWLISFYGEVITQYKQFAIEPT